MRLTKEEFLRGIDNLERMCKERDIICDALGCNECFLDDWIWKYYDLIYSLCDFSENGIGVSDLSYFCWEIDFGKDWSPGDITDENGNDVKLKTAEDLWKEITKERGTD